jgi:membrane protease YdiL (CAAX protease family)
LVNTSNGEHASGQSPPPSNTPEHAVNPPATRTPPLWRARDVVLIASLSISFVLGGIVMFGALIGWITGIDLRLIRSAASSALDPATYGVYIVGIAALQGAIMLAVLWRFGLLRGHHHWTDLWIQRLSAAQIRESAFAFLALRAFSIVVSANLYRLGITSSQAESIAPSAVTLPTALATLFFVGVLVPFAEEAFFRGVLYRWLRDKWNPAVGMIVSSLIFGIVHVQPSTVINATLLGFGLSWLYERHKSLWSCTLVHALSNLSSLVVIYLLIAFGIDLRPQ